MVRREILWRPLGCGGHETPLGFPLHGRVKAVSQPSNTRIEKKLARICVRAGCDVEVLDADECPVHHEESKRWKRESAARIRNERRRSKRCIDCGRKSNLQRCMSCYRRTRGVECNTEGVDKRSEVWREDPGTNWLRYRGRGRRGRLTREERLNEDARDAQFAAKQIGQFIENLDGLKQPDALQSPKHKLESMRKQAAAPLAHAARFIDDLLERYDEE